MVPGGSFACIAFKSLSAAFRDAILLLSIDSWLNDVFRIFVLHFRHKYVGPTVVLSKSQVAACCPLQLLHARTWLDFFAARSSMTISGSVLCVCLCFFSFFLGSCRPHFLQITSSFLREMLLGAGLSVCVMRFLYGVVVADMTLKPNAQVQRRPGNDRKAMRRGSVPCNAQLGRGAKARR